MKKMFFALAALVLAFTGCSQEDEAIQANEKKAFKVVVNMDKPGFGTDARAARQGWEEGDEVVVTLAGQLTAYVKLTYQEDETWKNQIFMWQEPDGEEGRYVELTEDESASFIAEIESGASTGDVMAVYFSSGVMDENSYYIEPAEVSRVAVEPEPELAELHLTTNACSDEDYPEGECVMTCEDGTYSVSDGELTLDITMLPRVAQFTIRDLSVDNTTSRIAAVPDDSETLYVEYVGTMYAYAGGSITTDGIRLNFIGGPYITSAKLHENEDGISIYASPWREMPSDLPDDLADNFDGLGYFSFQVKKGDDTYTREFTGKTDLKNGDAVIMDGPFTQKDGVATAGAQAWETE